MRLREATLADAPFVDERASDPTSMGEFNDFGLAHRTLAETLAERGRLVGFEKGQLLIDRLSDGKLVGDVSWHAVSYGPGDRSKALNFGLSLIPDARGHGYGTEAQRLLAALLFRLFDIERIEASTDVESIAEQRSLEKAGFTREGILRHAQWRAGAHHDLVSYSILREDL
jgi:RimJ/RimL family protein N-acetyltransferase